MEIAEYCKQDIQSRCELSDRMSMYSVFYASIMEDGQLIVSLTPHVLNHAKQGIVVHQWNQLAYSIWYETYLVHIINSDGTVTNGKIDDNYAIKISAARFKVPAKMSLSYNDEIVYTCNSYKRYDGINRSWHESLKFVWSLYLMCKDNSKSITECKMLCQLAEREQLVASLKQKLLESTIKECYLQEQLLQYKELLNKVLDVVDKE